MKRLLATIILFLILTPAYPCLIFVLTNGKQVIVGNHEDWTARDARIRFIPANKDNLGVAVFDFESESFIQGGVNDAGLFFDATATPFVAMDLSGKEVLPEKDFWLTLLQRCKTVREAVAFVERYQVPELERVHLFFADRNGQSVIVGAYDGKITLTWRAHSQQTLTNFNITDPEYGGEQPCPRYATATTILSKPANDALTQATDVLKQTTQGELTVYSTLFDLTRGTFTVYYLGDFSRSLSFDLQAELGKGLHAVSLASALR